MDSVATVPRLSFLNNVAIVQKKRKEEKLFNSKKTLQN